MILFPGPESNQMNVYVCAYSYIQELNMIYTPYHSLCFFIVSIPTIHQSIERKGEMILGIRKIVLTFVKYETGLLAERIYWPTLFKSQNINLSGVSRRVQQCMALWLLSGK